MIASEAIATIRAPARALYVLVASTLAFTVCFAVWMMFAVIGIPIRDTLGLNATQFGLLTATPVLSGSLIRVPLRMWTDRYGGRVVWVSLIWMYWTEVRGADLMGAKARQLRFNGRRFGHHAFSWRAAITQGRP